MSSSVISSPCFLMSFSRHSDATLLTSEKTNIKSLFSNKITVNTHTEEGTRGETKEARGPQLGGLNSPALPSQMAKMPSLCLWVKSEMAPLILPPKKGRRRKQQN